MYKTSLILPSSLDHVETAILGESLIDLCVAHSALRRDNNERSPWLIEWLFDTPGDEKIIRARLEITAALHDIILPPQLDFQSEAVPDRNWLEYSYAQFPAFTVGPFFIYGAHHETSVPDGLIGLQIDAATAFGSGEHGTTKGCLQAMLDLKGLGVCPWNVLDMGTGSGILGIAAWKLWKTPVLAVDNDPECIRVTQRHMAANTVPATSGNMATLVNEGFAGSIVQDKGPYELIIANILAGPLKDMAADLARCVDDNGYVILSGILNEQADDVRSVYESTGLKFRKKLTVGDWSALVLQKS